MRAEGLLKSLKIAELWKRVKVRCEKKDSNYRGKEGRIKNTTKKKKKQEDKIKQHHKQRSRGRKCGVCVSLPALTPDGECEKKRLTDRRRHGNFTKKGFMAI